MRRYANRPDLLAELNRVAAKLAEPAGSPPDDTPYEEGMARGGRQRRVADLLAPDDIKELVASFKAGVAKHRLATKYGISVSSVKRLLRQHRSQQSDAA